MERFGPIQFCFDLPADESGLEMKLVRWSVFGLPLPLVLSPRIEAREWEQDGNFRFDVTVAMPLAGEIVRYQGWLRPAGHNEEGRPAAGSPFQTNTEAAA